MSPSVVLPSWTQPRPHMTTPVNDARSSDRATLLRVACRALQSNTVSVDQLHGYLYQTYQLSTSKGFFYLLRSRPSSNVRLLRHEEDRLICEATALQTLGRHPEVAPTRLIEYNSTSIALGSHYLISGPFSGVILAQLEPSLSGSELGSIDRSLGKFVQRLCAISGPTFGPLRQPQGCPGFRSWARAFTALFEAVLRDGEDGLISLPYDGLRELVRRHRPSLDVITRPKLMLLELASDGNIAVSPKSLEVSGLLDYSTAYWGDPYMSDCFYKPTASFAQGFGRLPNKSGDERVRQYLYILYHTSLAVIRQCYRPSEGNGELDARRDMTQAMTQLNNIS